MVADQSSFEPDGLVRREDGTPDLQPGDRIEVSNEDAPQTTIRATVHRLLTDRDEGLGAEIDDYTACWIEIIPDGSDKTETVQVAWLGSNFEFRLNGRPVAIHKSRD